jgi:glycerate 2-kinase
MTLTVVALLQASPLASGVMPSFMPRHILIAPDKFKGSLTALQAAEAIATGIIQQEPDAVLDLCPIADGGEGFMETLAATLTGKWIKCNAVDALSRPIQSRYYLAETPHGLTAMMEMAETSGLWRLTPAERQPLRTTTRGVGMQMAHAISNHAVQRIILGLGGSATNDGGTGMAAALGILFQLETGEPLDPIPMNLQAVSRLDFSHRLPLPEIIAACDVENPLLGISGATAIFSAQKGASPQDQFLLESALSHLVSISDGQHAASMPGAGAAGGLGFGLLHFTGASLVSGFDLLAGLLDLKKRIMAADIVITGEGSLDAQSLSGKGPVALARLAQSLGKTVIGYCGRADAAVRQSQIFSQIHALADSDLPTETLMSQAASLLAQCAADTRF